MNRLRYVGTIILQSAMIGLLTMGLMVTTAPATDYTWNGGGGDTDPALNSAANWVGGVTPPFSATNDVYYFAGTSPTVPIVVPSYGVG
ncbi:MAG: hypothetical protein JXB10_18095, partial [Pirellulales bacterium]|nr:hypothetical protein [Pirellulales bacterium]